MMDDCLPVLMYLQDSNPENRNDTPSCPSLNLYIFGWDLQFQCILFKKDDYLIIF